MVMLTSQSPKLDKLDPLVAIDIQQIELVFRIAASDNETYDVEKDVAVRSVLIANMMEGESGFWFF